MWLLALGCVAWAFGALHHDFPVLKVAVAWGFALAVLAALIFARGAGRRLGATFLGGIARFLQVEVPGRAFTIPTD